MALRGGIEDCHFTRSVGGLEAGRKVCREVIRPERVAEPLKLHLLHEDISVRDG